MKMLNLKEVAEDVAVHLKNWKFFGGPKEYKEAMEDQWNVSAETLEKLVELIGKDRRQP